MKVEVYGTELEVIEDRPLYSKCHPDEGYLNLPPDYRCEHCVIAAMPDNGEPVILWGCGNRMNWSVNRSDMGFEDKLYRLKKLGGQLEAA